MLNRNFNKTKYFSLEVLILILIGIFYLTLPNLLKQSWFSVVVWIREAIHSGDGAKLFLASTSVNFTYALLSFTTYLWSLLLVKFFFTNIGNSNRRLLIIATYLIIRIISRYLGYPVEVMLDFVSMIIILLLTKYANMNLDRISTEVIISLQVLIALQWTNTMPAMSAVFIGQTDLPVSIKISGAYLDNTLVQNMISLAFMVPLLLSATMTSMRIRANKRMLAIYEENMQRAKELKDAQTKIMENRVYKEVNAMAHDLKTPLVTIRGLNSMLMLSKDMNKLIPYSERIENAVEKMSELISGFLYGSHRQKITSGELINYVRAQVPIDNELINFDFTDINENLSICGNKIRLSRAIINIIENAIIATGNQDTRSISLNCVRVNNDIKITIMDNGKGVEYDKISHLFDIGYSGVGSTGLGLPFAKQILEEHDGSIHIESELGLGTSVIITVPIYEE